MSHRAQAALSQYLPDLARRLQPHLVEAVRGLEHRYTPSLLDAMDHCLQAGGKRVRPAVVELWARSAGAGREEEVLRAGAAVELIHTASLLLDDLPSMDDARTRRGRPCCHLIHGVDTAILAANALLMRAFQWLGALDRSRPSLGATELLARAVGAEGMIGGQHVDLHLPPGTRGLESMEYVHSHKTGILFEACARLGVRLGGGDVALEQAARVYARNLGLAFQIKDDLLDRGGDPAVMGKESGRDGDKPTFPRVLGLAESEEIMARLLDTARAALGHARGVDPLLAELCDYVGRRSS